MKQSRKQGTSQQRKRLTLAIISALCLTAGLHMDVSAAVKNVPITGVASVDQASYGKRYVQETDDAVTYKLYGKTTITPTDTKLAPISIQTDKSVSITSTGDLELLPKDANEVKGILLGDDQDLTITMQNKAKLVIRGHATGYSANGISLVREGLGTGSASNLTIQGDVVIKGNTSDMLWGISSDDIHAGLGSQGKGYTGARWQPAGIYLGQSFGSTLTIDGQRSDRKGEMIPEYGNVDIAVKGTAITTDPYYASEDMNDESLATLSINNANIHILTPRDDKESFYSVANYGGTININTDSESSDNEVTIDGNMLVMSDRTGLGGEFFYRSGVINVKLLNANSYWRGIVDNAGKDLHGTMNLSLENGAKWYHEAMTPGNGLHVESMPKESKTQYKAYDGTTYVNELTAGNEESMSQWGRIHQMDKAPIHIEKFSGKAMALYKHENDGMKDSDFTGGAITVDSAESGSVIQLATDMDGIALDNQDSTKQVLANLSHKLYYRGAIADKEQNLTASVSILEGLTNPTLRSIYTSPILFSKDNGQGSVDGIQAGDIKPDEAVSDHQNRFDYTGAMITGHVDKDTLMHRSGVTKDGQTYTFAKDTTLHIDETTRNAVSLVEEEETKQPLDHGVTLEGTDATLSITGKAEADVQAILVKTLKNPAQTPLTVNVKAVNIDLSSEESRIDAIRFYQDLNEEAHKTIINSDTHIKVHARRALGVYVYGKEHVTFNKNLTIELDGKSGGWEYLSDHGVYASGVLGAPKILPPRVVIKGDYKFIGPANGVWANTGNAQVDVQGNADIRVTKAVQPYSALGAGLGIVSVNYKSNPYTGASTYNKEVHIEGNLTTDHSAQYKFWEEPDMPASARFTQVNLGLSTPTSWWKGLAHNTLTPEAHDKGYVDEINLILQNEAQWTNTQVGDLIPEAKRPKPKPTPENPKPKRPKNIFAGSHIHTLTGGVEDTSAGIIFQQDTRPITVDTLSGHVKVLYQHDKQDPTKFEAGDFIVTQAKQTKGKNAGVTMVTDSDGITMTDESAVGKVLDALAHKLVYQNYVNKERFLDGTVWIAEGLTASSKSKAVGDVFFNKEDGRGYYTTEVVEDPDNIPASQTLSKLSKPITGVAAQDTAYKYSGILKEGEFVPSYTFTKDSSITAAGTYTADNKTGTPWESAIYYNQNSHDDFDGDDTPINIELSKKTLAVTTKGKGNVAGVAAFNGGIVNLENVGGLTVTVGHTDDKAVLAGLVASGAGSELTVKKVNDLSKTVIPSITVAADKENTGLVGAYATEGGTLTIDGELHVDTDATGHGIYAKGGTVHTQSGGHIATPGGYAIQSEDKGKAFVNLNQSGTYITLSKYSTDMQINGDVLTNDAETYLSVGKTKKSEGTWHGGALTTNNGKFSLFLQQGAQWFHDTKNEAITESVVTVLNPKMGAIVGETGYIWQQSDKAIHVNLYQGATQVFYAHDANDVTKVQGGNFIIDNVQGDAHGHPMITIVTDINGVTKANAKSLMNALAGKLIWTNVDNSINTDSVDVSAPKVKYSLRGYVKLAEGLTTSAVIKRMGTIAFYDKEEDGHVKGQGYLKPLDPTKPIHTSEVISEDRLIEANGIVKIENNKMITALYADGAHKKENPMIVDLNGSNLTLHTKVDKTNGAVGSAIAVSPNQYVQIKDSDPSGNTLYLGGESNDTRAVKAATLRTHANLVVDVPVVVDSLATEGMSAVGLEAFGEDSHAHFTKDVTIQSMKAAGKHGKDKVNTENGENIIGLQALGVNSDITIDGAFTVKDFRGVAAKACDRGAKIALQQTDITVKDPTGNDKTYALIADKGEISVNGTRSGDAFTAGNHDVRITGDVMVNSQHGKRVAEYSQGQLVDDGAEARLDMALTTKNSKWDGTALYSKKLVDLSKVQVGGSDGVVDGSHLEELKAQQKGAGYTKHDPGTLNLTVQNGAQWNHKLHNVNVDPTWTGPEIHSLQGGDSVHSAGIISQQDSHAITVDTLSGAVRVNYAHDQADATKVQGGDFIVKQAGDKAHVALATDRDGVSDTIGEANGIDKVMSALASKLHYLNVNEAPKALQATVEIGEGLTAPEMVQQGMIQFNTDASKGAIGQGTFVYENENSIQSKNVAITADGKTPIQEGSAETVMMRGVKAAQNEAVMLWRAEQNDLQKRMGDLHYAPTDEGVWARMYGGKFDSNANHADFDGTFKAVQVGVDKKIGNTGWRTGIAASYLDTNKSNIVGGTADGKMTSVAVYGTKLGQHEDYLDIYAKVSQLKTNFHVMNETQYTLDGTYKATGVTVSAEYGRKFAQRNGMYVEPQVELTYGHLPGKTYQAMSSYSNNKAMTIAQGSYDSFIARLGIGIGKHTDTTDMHARLSLYHDFKGGMQTVYSAPGEPTTTVTQDYSRTWWALAAGITHQMNAKTSWYGTMERTFGGDLHYNWRADVGVRINF